MSVPTLPAHRPAVDRAPAGAPTLSRSTAVLVFVGLLGAAATVALMAAGTDVRLAFVPVVGAGALVLTLTATMHFEVFVLVLLLVRASIDSLSITGGRATDPTVALGLLMAIAGPLWLLAAGPRRPDEDRAGVAGPALLLGVTASISLAGSLVPATTLSEVLRLTSALIMLVVLCRLVELGTSPWRLVAIVFLSAAVPAASAVHQAVTGGGTDLGGFLRVHGTFTHPNPLSIYLCLLLLMAVAVLPHVHGRRRGAVVLLLVVLAPTLLLTYTRSAWLAFVLGLLVIGVLQTRKIIPVLVVGLLVVLVAVPSVSARFADLSSSTQASGDANNSLFWRVSYWQETVGLADERPVTGIGLGAVRVVSEAAKAPHNDLVRAYTEMGVLGLTAYLLFLGSLVRVGLRALRRAGPGLDRGIAVGFAAATAALLLLSLVSNILSQVVVLWYYAAFAAAAYGVGRRGPGRSTDVAQV